MHCELGYAEDTWLVHGRDGRPGHRAARRTTSAATSTRTTAPRYTSPTNIGAYLWSTIVARDLRIITAPRRGAGSRRPSPRCRRWRSTTTPGMFYNWYDPATGEKLTAWPDDGDTVYPFLSSVDNGWLATGAAIVVDAGAVAAPTRRDAVLDEMNFGFYYDPAREPDPRRVLGRAAARLQRPGQLPRRRDRLLHLPPLRRVQHRAADRQLPRHRRRADPAASTTSATWRTFPRQLRLVLGGAEAGRRVARATSASRSSRAPTATAACSSCRRGAAACSRR